MWILTKKGNGAGKAGIHLALFLGLPLYILSITDSVFFAVSNFVYSRMNLDSPWYLFHLNGQDMVANPQV